MKKLPKISFSETKQIIPHNNLFGKSNFAANAFDVLIQLTNRNKINVVSDIGSDSDDHDNRCETNQRGTHGESDFRPDDNSNSGDGRSLLSLNDVVEAEDGNENKIGDNN